jgi:5'(3')-deoxyribonucleotidase
MKITELLESKQESKPTVFVDMDGVLADLCSHAAELSDVDHYNDMTPEQWESFFRDSDAYHLFRSIQPFSTANELLRLVTKYAGGYRILSSPLNFDREGSIKGKREWLKKHINVPADKIVFEHDKYKYAVQPDGTPNILIDDYGVNTRAWDAAGGTAIKYQADEDSLDKIVRVLQKVFEKDK